MSKILDLAEEVLEKAPVPLTYREIWNVAKSEGIPDRLEITGKTPWFTLSARLGSDIEKGGSRFVIVSRNPRRFFLKRRQEALTSEVPKAPHLEESQMGESGGDREEFRFIERDLHPLLAYFVHSNPGFWGDREVYAKTIRHEKSTLGLKEWLHPDMVGVYLPFEDMEEKVIALNREVGQESVFRLFSFELKKELTRKNYRECFFQAVSNSSWAHAGYLVAAKIPEDEELDHELERLSSAFGIGIIYLDLEDIDASYVVYPAKTKSTLNWETINKLYALNEDFREFIDNVHDDIKTIKIRPLQYDSVLEEPSEYIQTQMKVRKTI